MSSTTPSATRNSASLDRLQLEKGRLWSCGRERHLLDGLALGKGELRRASAGVLRGQRVEPVGVEVMDDFTDPVLGGEGDLGDGGDVHGLGGPQHDLGSSPSDHRSRTSSHDAEQLVALGAGDSHGLAHVRPSPKSARPGPSDGGRAPINVGGHGTSHDAIASRAERSSLEQSCIRSVRG